MKKFVSSLIFIIFSFFLFGQNLISYKGNGNYILRERTDLRRYDNGKYFGLVNQEVSSFIIPVSFENYYIYEGEFYILQDTRKNSYNVSKSIDEAIPASFKIDKSGHLTMIQDNGFPTFRSFPTYSDKRLQLGDIWEAKAERAVDPLNKGIITKMPIYVQYKYLKDDFFNGQPVYVISAQWATRYGMGTGNYYIDWSGDKDLQKATGSHKATLYVSKITGHALLIQDLIDETFFYNDGNQYQFKGTISQFTEYPPAIDRSKILPALKRIASITEEQEKELLNPKTSDELIAMASQNDNTDSHNVIQEEIPAASSNTTSNVLSKLNSTLTGTSSSNIVQNYDKQQNLVTVDNTEAGIRLTIPDLQFVANSSELLSGEQDRLNKIAAVLLEIPGCRFLIEGHTASTGLPRGELQLSIERAQSIKNELTKRGIEAERFICKGSGGTKPIADNSTSEGKAKNRRVEITILE